tara:strand:- start:306 stop:425 length:120 start_codon:yes stop_codon:yes gene_type:complete
MEQKKRFYKPKEVNVTKLSAFYKEVKDKSISVKEKENGE